MIILGEYFITNYNIANGSFSIIHKGKHKYTNEIVAIKEIKVKNIFQLKNYVKRELESTSKIKSYKYC